MQENEIKTKVKLEVEVELIKAKTWIRITDQKSIGDKLTRMRNETRLESIYGKLIFLKVLPSTICSAQDNICALKILVSICQKNVKIQVHM